MKRRIFSIAVLFLFLVSCTPGLISSQPENAFATPTRNPLFPAVESSSDMPVASNLTPGVPTLASIFQPAATSTVRIANTPLPSVTPGAVISDQPIVEVETVAAPTLIELGETVYFDRLNAGWGTRTDGVEIDLENTTHTFQGKNSIKVTPQGEFGTAYFVLQSGITSSYTRDRVLGLRFKLSGGDAAIEPSDLAVTVLGSNQYNYYVEDDTSVTNQYDPIFPETRLYFLNINQTIRPNTWVDVVVWLDDLIYEPIYNNVTGFYINNDEVFQNSYYIDSVELILLTEQNQALASANDPAGGQLLTSHDTINLTVNVTQNVHPISPMIYGVSNAPAEVLKALNPGLNSWGGDSSSRYNWEVGNAWNGGRDFFYQNTNYGVLSGSASDAFIEDSLEAGAAVRLTLPTLGWVAKNSDLKTCSFPLPDGSCGDADGATCFQPGEIADPKLANVASDVDSIVEWVTEMLVENEYEIDILAMDNEPEMWGVTHYDVHPECTTYQEILDQYLVYAEAVRTVAPRVDLAGPVTCCWEYYFDSAAGPVDKLNNGNQDFLPWFLEQVKKHDLSTGTTSINVLDLHYYPEGLFNQNVDTATAAQRLRAPRSLWDTTYVDESWIAEPISLIPRMLGIIADNYPGLRLGISEWNFGADQSMNGALAIADVLGIYGRENLYYASYSDYPKLGSPGAFAFQMYTNYDGEGGHFGDMYAQTISDTPDLITAYASMDNKTRQAHIIIINKDPIRPLGVNVKLSNFGIPSTVELYRYSQEDLTSIVKSEEEWPGLNGILIIPPYSINHYVLTR
jgi:hypothetical protein